ncbi:MAG: 50S ribosomal protein L18 [bacterium]
MAGKNKIRTLKRERKKLHIRKKITGTAERPRLAVFRSAKNIYAQMIDDVNNRTLTAVSTLSPDLKAEVSKSQNKVEAAKLVGKGIAEKAKSMKIKNVVFDRGGYLYHGRVKALADGARENGLEF